MRKDQQQVLEFHKKYGQSIGEYPSVCPPEELKLRMELMDEEITETLKAVWQIYNRVQQDKPIPIDLFIEFIDGLVDTMYVINGTAVAIGIDLEPFYDAVHEANMTKTVGIREPGQKYAKTGKGPDFKKADLHKILINQMNRLRK